jgi:NADH:ubiquinone oxidoreductase subunit
MSGRPRDVVWEHGENLAPGWRCNYCHTEKGGGGSTRLKQHLAGRGAEVVHCNHVPPEVRQYFQRELDKTRQRTTDRARERLAQERVAQEGNHPRGEDEYEAHMQQVLEQSRVEYEYEQRVHQRGGDYERGGGSGGGGGGSRRGNPISRMFSRREGSQRDTPVVVEDYQAARGGSRGMHQPRIDTGSWTQKGKNAKHAIGKAWSKWFHYVGVPGRNADNPYFVGAVRETQKWGKYLYLETYAVMYPSVFSLFAYGF